MNKFNAKDYLPLVQALAEGKTIQMRTSDGWKEYEDYGFVSPAPHYRIKPEPREIWVNEYAGVPAIAYTSEVAAIKNALVGVVRKAIHYREVCDD